MGLASKPGSTDYKGALACKAVFGVTLAMSRKPAGCVAACKEGRLFRSVLPRD